MAPDSRQNGDHPVSETTVVPATRFGRSGGRRRFRRRRAPDDGAAAQSVPEMRAELVLLREENARLMAAEHGPTTFGRLLGRARSLPSSQIAHEEFADEAAQALVEVVVLRDSLLEVCGELERSLGAVRAQLDAIAAVGDDHLNVLAPRSHGSQVVAEQMLREGLNGGSGNT